MNALETEIVGKIKEIYHKGMLDFETTCEKNIMASGMTHDEMLRLQAILDESQRVFEDDESKEYSISDEIARLSRWQPIENYFKQKGKYDWVIVQFEEKDTGFRGIPHIAEYRESRLGHGWYVQDDDEEYSAYFNEACKAVSFKPIDAFYELAGETYD